MVEFDTSRVNEIYQALRNNSPTAKHALMIALAPLAEICTDQYILTRKYMKRHRDDLQSRGRESVVCAIESLAARTAPVFSARQYVSKIVERDIVSEGIELSRRPSGVGPKAATVKKAASELKSQRKRRRKWSDECKAMGRFRPCCYCVPPHVTENWYPLYPKWHSTWPVAFACKNAWENGAFWHSGFAKVSEQRAVVWSLIDEADQGVNTEITNTGTGEMSEDILSLCNSDRQRQILSLRLEGLESSAIAEQIGCSTRSVQLAIKELGKRYQPWYEFLAV